MTRNIFIAGVMCAAILFSSSFAGKDHGPCKDNGKHKGRMMHELNLTDEQKAQLMELRKEMRESMKKNGKEMKELHKAVKEEFKKDTPSEAELSEIAKKMGDFHQVMAELKFKHLLDVKDILDAEQFKKLLRIEWMQKDGYMMRGKHDFKRGCSRDCDKPCCKNKKKCKKEKKE